MNRACHKNADGAPERAYLDHVELVPPGTATAASTELSPPAKDKGLAGISGQAFGENSKADPTIIVAYEAERKGLVNLRARYALAGFVLVEISDGSLLATRWNRTRQLQDVSAALHFLRQIGGAK
jgi:hypothetical protein